MMKKYALIFLFLAGCGAVSKNEKIENPSEERVNRADDSAWRFHEENSFGLVTGMIKAENFAKGLERRGLVWWRESSLIRFKFIGGLGDGIEGELIVSDLDIYLNLRKIPTHISMLEGFAKEKIKEKLKRAFATEL